jgi:hypothetical protein
VSLSRWPGLPLNPYRRALLLDFKPRAQAVEPAIGLASIRAQLSTKLCSGVWNPTTGVASVLSDALATRANS